MIILRGSVLATLLQLARSLAPPHAIDTALRAANDDLLEIKGTDLERGYNCAQNGNCCSLPVARKERGGDPCTSAPTTALDVSDSQGSRCAHFYYRRGNKLWRCRKRSTTRIEGEEHETCAETGRFGGRRQCTPAQTGAANLRELQSANSAPQPGSPLPGSRGSPLPRACLNIFRKEKFEFDGGRQSYERTSRARSLAKRCIAGDENRFKLVTRKFPLKPKRGVHHNARDGLLCFAGIPTTATKEAIECGDAMQTAVCGCYDYRAGSCGSSRHVWGAEDAALKQDVDSWAATLKCKWEVPTDAEMLASTGVHQEFGPCVNPNRKDEGAPLRAASFVSDCPPFSNPKHVLPLPETGPAKFGRPRYRYVKDDLLMPGAAHEAVKAAGYVLFATTNNDVVTYYIAKSASIQPGKSTSFFELHATVLYERVAGDPWWSIPHRDLYTFTHSRVYKNSLEGADPRPGRQRPPPELKPTMFEVPAVRELYVMVQLTSDGLKRRFGTVVITPDNTPMMYHGTLGYDSKKKKMDDFQWERGKSPSGSCSTPRYKRTECTGSAGAAFLSPDWWYPMIFVKSKFRGKGFGPGRARIIEYKLLWKRLELLDFGWFEEYSQLAPIRRQMMAGYGYHTGDRLFSAKRNRRIEWRELAFGMRRNCKSGAWLMCRTSALEAIYRRGPTKECWASGKARTLDMERHTQENFDMTVLSVILEEEQFDHSDGTQKDYDHMPGTWTNAGPSQIHGYAGNDYLKGREFAITKFPCGKGQAAETHRVFALASGSDTYGWAYGQQICPCFKGPPMKANPTAGKWIIDDGTKTKYKRLDAACEKKCVPWGGYTSAIVWPSFG